MELNRWMEASYGLARRLLQQRKTFVAATEVGITSLACILAFELRFDFAIPKEYFPQLWAALLLSVPVKVAFLLGCRVHLYSFRYVCVEDVGRLILVQLCSSSLSALLIGAVTQGFPRSIFLLQLLLSIMFTAGIRAGSLLIGELIQRRRAKGEFRNAVVYGAGAAGVALVRELRSNPTLAYSVKGFIDDQKNGRGLLIHGTRVLGRGEDLPVLTKRYNLEVALIAIPSASGHEMSEILEQCARAGLKSLTIPGIGHLMEGKGLARQLRDVAVEDLLGRSPVRLDEDRIRSRHANRTVLVTGAAGSIGSELCRQLARFGPAKIVGFDMAESGLFEIEQELAANYPNVGFSATVGSIQNSQRLSEVFAEHRPSIVYHAAAFKHVPMMEQHVFEAVENNIFGTLNVAIAAGRNQVEDFVMISSDKAVRPTNVMGATKRIAEMVIRSLDKGATKYVSVRFGNVLGSNGSVVPIFKRQIAQGGPVRVTHPDMKRYFMTIPEATQLVLQSATMGQGGEIFVLDMGEPVRIVDLARNLILLSGFRPEEDIRVEFSGVRPGEKLYEELNSDGENTLPTYHEKIKIFSGSGLSWGAMERRLGELQRQCAIRKLDGVMLTIKELVPDYNPSTGLLRRAMQPNRDEFALAEMSVETVQ